MFRAIQEQADRVGRVLEKSQGPLGVIRQALAEYASGQGVRAAGLSAAYDEVTQHLRVTTSSKALASELTMHFIEVRALVRAHGVPVRHITIR